MSSKNINIIESKNLEEMKLMLTEYPNSDQPVSGNKLFRWACKNGHIEVAKILLKNKSVDPTASRNSAIRSASKNGHAEVVKILLKDERVNPADLYNDAIDSASKNGHVKVVKALLKDKRVNPGDYRKGAVRKAFRNNNDKVLEILLKDRRVDPELIGMNRWNSWNGHRIRFVKLLIPEDEKKRRNSRMVYDDYAITRDSHEGYSAITKLGIQDDQNDQEVVVGWEMTEDGDLKLLYGLSDGYPWSVIKPPNVGG